MHRTQQLSGSAGFWSQHRYEKCLPSRRILTRRQTAQQLVRYAGMGHMDTNVPEKNVEDNVRDHRLLLADRHVEL